MYSSSFLPLACQFIVHLGDQLIAIGQGESTYSDIQATK